VDFFRFVGDRWSSIWPDLLAHFEVVAIAVAIAAAASVAAGILAYDRDRLASAFTTVASVLLTIPSLALFAIFVPFIGLGYLPTVIALVLYALLPILRNTIAGMRGVDAAIVESARGMGLSKRQRLIRVQLPLAWPVILTGIRVSTLIIVGIAAIAAIVHGPGLGDLIFTGLNEVGNAVALDEIIAGTLGVVIVALVFDIAYQLIGVITTSRGLRGRS
jgi:osmoprotectant transport system permease protein